MILKILRTLSTRGPKGTDEWLASSVESPIVCGVGDSRELFALSGGKCCSAC